MLIACHITKSSPLKEHTTGMLTELKFNGDCKFAWQYWHRQEPKDIWGEQGKPEFVRAS